MVCSVTRLKQTNTTLYLNISSWLEIPENIPISPSACWQNPQNLPTKIDPSEARTLNLYQLEKKHHHNTIQVSVNWKKSTKNQLKSININ